MWPWVVEGRTSPRAASASVMRPVFIPRIAHDLLRERRVDLGEDRLDPGGEAHEHHRLAGHRTLAGPVERQGRQPLAAQVQAQQRDVRVLGVPAASFRSKGLRSRGKKARSAVCFGT